MTPKRNLRPAPISSTSSRETLPTNTIAPELDDVNAMAALKLYDGSAVGSSSTLDVQALGTYLAYLVAIGFLPPPPAGNRGSSLPQLDMASSQVLAASQFGGRSAKP